MNLQKLHNFHSKLASPKRCAETSDTIAKATGTELLPRSVDFMKKNSQSKREEKSTHFRTNSI